MNKTFKNKYDHIKATFRTRPFKPEKNHDKALFKRKNELFKRLYINGLNLLTEIELKENFIKDTNENFLNKNENFDSCYKLNLTDFKECLKFYDDYIIVDLRDEYDYNTSRIKGSIWCPLFLINLNKIPEIINQYNKDHSKLIFFYHQNNKYSEQAADIIYERGIVNSIMIEGGIDLLITKKSHLIENNKNHNIIPSNNTIRHPKNNKKISNYEKPNEILMNTNTFSVIENKKILKKNLEEYTVKPNNFNPQNYIKY